MQTFRCQFPPPPPLFLSFRLSFFLSFLPSFLSFFLSFLSSKRESSHRALFSSIVRLQPFLFPAPSDTNTTGTASVQFLSYSVYLFALQTFILLWTYSHQKDDLVLSGNHQNFKNFGLHLINSDSYTYTQFPLCHPLTLQFFILVINSQSMPTLYTFS